MSSALKAVLHHQVDEAGKSDGNVQDKHNANEAGQDHVDVEHQGKGRNEQKRDEMHGSRLEDEGEEHRHAMQPGEGYTVYVKGLPVSTRKGHLYR